MRLNPIVLTIIATAFFSQCRTKKQTVVGTKTVCINYTETYCGGAAPPEEMLREMRKMKPFANQQIAIYKSNSDDFKPYMYKTNENGEVTLPMNLGNQVFISCYPTAENYTLKHNLAGMWSRRINQEHRIVYKVEENIITVYSLRFHYTK